MELAVLVAASSRRGRHAVAHGEGRRARATAAVGGSSRRAGTCCSRLPSCPVACPHGRLGVGYRAIAALPPPAEEATLTLADVDVAFASLATASGPGSAGARRATSGHAVLGGHRRRARLPGGSGDGRGTSGRARRDHAARRRAGGRGAARVRTPRSHARRHPRRGRRGRTDRRRRGVGADRAGAAPAHRADARRVGAEHRRRHDDARTLVGRAQARRDPDPGAQAGRRGTGLHPVPRRHHRPPARGRRGGRGAPRRDAGARRRGDRAAPGRPARSRSRSPARARRPHGIPCSCARRPR
jgi:hypothetical protein